MDESGFTLSKAKVVIIGLGLMGGSLALALRESCHQLDGLDNDEPTLALARELKIADYIGSDPTNIMVGADLVILACPVPAIVEWLTNLPVYIQRSCIVIDVGSTKRTIMAAMDALPANFDPIGSHAICGKEQLSLRHAEASLFNDAPFVLTDLKRTTEKARSAAIQIVKVCGANPVWMDAITHDRILAATSHLPYLISSALSMILSAEAAPLVGPGFKSTSRLAATPSNMMLGVLQSNSDNILEVIKPFRDQLDIIENALKENDTKGLESILDSARDRYTSSTL